MANNDDFGKGGSPWGSPGGGGNGSRRGGPTPPNIDEIIKKSKVYESLEPAMKNIDFLISTTSRFRNKNIDHIKLNK